MRLHFKILFCTIGFFFTQDAICQQEDSRVKISYADSSVYLSEDKKQKLHGNVRLVHDSIFMYCDTSVLRENRVEAQGNIVIIQDDTIHTFSDSLYYDGNLKLAELFYNVVLKNGDKKLFTEKLTYHLEDKYAVFQDTAILESGTMTLSSLRGRYFVDDKKAKFFDQVTIIDGDLRLKTDSLDYDADIDRAYFLGPTYITEEGRKIYCESGYYDIGAGRAFFSNDAVVYEGNRTAKAEDISYDDKNNTVTFSGDAELIDSVSTVSGQEIIINDSTNVITVIGEGRFEDADQIVEGEYIEYNEDTEDVLIKGRGQVYREDGQLSADSISYQKEIDRGYAQGTVIWQDTVDNTTVESDILFYKDSSQYVKAILDEQRPLFTKLIDDDTLYLSADTLLTETVGDTLSYIKAISRVMIYKSDFQAICDSLYYDDRDSTFQLYYDPIVWSDTTQFSGDTLLMVTSNDEISEIIAKNKAFIAMEENDTYYNQIRGRYIHSYLDSNTLHKMNVQGNAESIYFVKDEEDAYVGPNKTVCADMIFYFENEELSHIYFETQPNNNLTPMDQVTDSDLYLDTFSWKGDRRPIDKSTLRLVSKISVGKEQTKSTDEFEEKVNEVILEDMKKSK